MNYYNPYFMSALPTYTNLTAPASSSLISGLRGSGLSLSTILNGAQKTLGFVNQVIPVARQLTPMMKNAKTMFRVMNEFKKVETPFKKQEKRETSIIPNEEQPSSNVYQNGPTFFI